MEKSLITSLGMDFDFSERGVASLSMIKKNLEQIFDDFPEEIGKASSTPASEHHFQVRDPDETERTGTNQMAQHFHHSVAQSLFLSTRVRCDIYIQMAVVFLTTRVKKSDVEDWGMYLKGIVPNT